MEKGGYTSPLRKGKTSRKQRGEGLSCQREQKKKRGKREDFKSKEKRKQRYKKKTGKANSKDKLVEKEGGLN